MFFYFMTGALAARLLGLIVEGTVPRQWLLVAVEAEHFFKQTLTDKRAWHLTTAAAPPKVTPYTPPTSVELSQTSSECAKRWWCRVSYNPKITSLIQVSSRSAQAVTTPEKSAFNVIS